MSENNKRKKIPAGWINCPNMSLGIIAEQFIVFKAPLDRTYNNRVSTIKRFHVETIFSSLYRKKVHLGLWIDLTNTDRYFNKFEVENMGCSYVKIPCLGHQKPPTRYEVNQFIGICWNFLQRNSSQIIGVHCTHGFNRTGFMIVSYLVEVFNLDLTTAITVFATSRPPGIYRQNLINELYKRYSNEAPFRITNCPPWV